MVPLALSEGELPATPRIREPRTISVSPEIVMATKAGVSRNTAICSARGPRLGSSKNSPWAPGQVYVGHGASSGTCAAASIGANPDSLGSSP